MTIIDAIIRIFMSPPLRISGRGIVFRLSVRLPVHCALTPISCDAISLYLVEGFQ